jgi:dCTP deaminase
MVINGIRLLSNPPIMGMLTEKHREHGVSHGLSEVGYDIRIKQNITFYPSYLSPGRIEIIDPGFEPVYRDGKFTIASTIEEFHMPTNLMGIVHDKSTWARRGVSVFNTVIEPGWKGFLTLELVYHGDEILEIPAGSGIAQVIFHQVAVPAAYEGKYQNQADMPVPAIAD